MRDSKQIIHEIVGLTQEYPEVYDLCVELEEKHQTEVDELKSTIEKQKKLSLKAIENAKAGSSLELQLAQKLHAESSPNSLESERVMNAQLTNENLMLESKVDELQKRVDWLERHLKAVEALSKMRAAVVVAYKTKDLNVATKRKMLLLRKAEQALKGGGE